MKLLDGFRLRSLGKEFIIVGEDNRLVDFNKMIALNSTAAYLWKEVQGKEFTVQTLSELLLAEYDVDKETAEKDSSAIAAKWIEAGIATE